MESYFMFKNLAIIIIAAKVCGILARKCKAPQVVGEIIAGLLIGPSILGWVEQSDFLVQLAEIGVVLLMFSAGLETDLKDLLKTGPIAALIACAGVFIPLLERGVRKNFTRQFLSAQSLLLLPSALRSNRCGKWVN